MKILAFDQASAVTGWALFVDGKLEQSGKIRVTAIKDAQERHKQMDIRTVDLLKAHSPDFVVIEDMYLGKSVSALKTVSQFRGLIIGYCHYHGIEIELMMPSSWRRLSRFVQGKETTRAQLKKQAQEYVQEHFDLKATQDEADAICIGYAAVCKYERGLS